MDGPDFLCIGQQKAGTTWLYDQLGAHPAFWMPPVKELHYFDRRFEPLKSLPEARWLEIPPDAVTRMNKARLSRGLHPYTDRDFAFLRRLRSLLDSDPSIEDYASLFREKGSQCSGDITPAYSSLVEARIATIARRFPSLKIVFLVRDPIERAWSQLNMTHRGGKFDVSLLDSPQRLRKFLQRDSFAKRSFASEIARLWQNHFPADRFRVFLFDEIAAHPHETRDTAARFLGAPSADIPLAADLNRGGRHEPKLEMTATVRQVFLDHFASELEASAAVFGGAALEWPSRYAP